MENVKAEVLKDKEKRVISYSFTHADEILVQKHKDAWTCYRKKWSKAQDTDSLNSDIPLYIVLELNSFCNLRCKMCKHADDHPAAERRSMPMAVFEKIMNECCELRIPSINIGSGTECTLHPQFDKIIQKVKESGAIDKFFLTNGSTLSEKMIDQIFEGGYERVEISIDAATKNVYEKIRKNGNFERLEKMILRLLEEKKRREAKLPLVRLSFCVQKDNIEEIDAFYDKWKGKVDFIEYQKVSLPGSIGQMEGKYKKCAQPFNRMTINYNGDIFPCCSILYQDRYCLGNIRQMSIYEAWHGEKMNMLRKSFRSGKLMQHCRECIWSVYGEGEEKLDV